MDSVHILCYFDIRYWTFLNPHILPSLLIFILVIHVNTCSTDNYEGTSKTFLLTMKSKGNKSVVIVFNYTVGCHTGLPDQTRTATSYFKPILFNQYQQPVWLHLLFWCPRFDIWGMNESVDCSLLAKKQAFV